MHISTAIDAVSGGVDSTMKKAPFRPVGYCAYDCTQKNSSPHRWLFPMPKHLSQIVLICVAAVVSFVALDVCHCDSLVIRMQSEEPGLLQVFFSKHGSYCEAESVQETYRAGVHDVHFAMPNRWVDSLRIDPSVVDASVVIESISLRSYPLTQAIGKVRLFELIRPIKMVREVSLTSRGLVIDAIGNDSALELPLRWMLLRQAALKCAALFAVLLGVIAIVSACSHTGHGQQVVQGVAFVAVPSSVSLLIACLFYPGFMSYDSLHALRGARDGVVDSAWPPMVSYVWRCVDALCGDPSAMHLTQVALLIFGLHAIVFMSTKSQWAGLLFLAGYLSVPVVLGTVAVIWKDVLMAAFFVAAFACILHLRRTRRHTVLFAMVAAGLLFMGVCSRHNAITGAVPLTVYLVYALLESLEQQGRLRWLWLVAISSGLIVGMYAVKRGLDHYSIPGLRRLAGAEAVGRGCKAMDLAGASVFLQRNLLQALAPEIDVQDIQRQYDPRHCNLSPVLQSIPNDERLDQAWSEAWGRYPVAMCYNKFCLAAYLLGANRGPQFYVTDPGVVENEFGFRLQNSPIRDAAVAYVVRACHWTVLKPWFIYVIAWLLLVPVIACGVMSIELFVLHSSAMLYLAGLIMYGNAADARLLFYSTTAMMLACCVSVVGVHACAKQGGWANGRWRGFGWPASGRTSDGGIVGRSLRYPFPPGGHLEESS